MSNHRRAAISIPTGERTALVDITDDVDRALHELNVHEGILVLFCPHTTAGLTINEGADPDVANDITETLARLVPAQAGYRHAEGNADAHVKSTLTGVSLSVAVEDGRVVLGRWQRIFFCEFDGPRSRRIWVRFIGT
ncbi:YjbQ family protein [Candidatus Fermentibacteria bacterium]|nr:YjbQ family protein [Candidatus Fermentibacteria bacterium]